MKIYFFTLTLLLMAGHLQAQNYKADTTKKAAPDTAMHMGIMQMNSQFSLDLPMNRDGSGTSWVPDATPMYAYMLPGSQWMSMVHGNFAPRYTNQDLLNKTSGRGGKRVDAPNWLMFMTQRQAGSGGLFSVNTMFSLDPFLIGEGGYPLLYQTGESYHGQKLVDKQHPHDLFSELSVAYTQRVAKSTEVSASFGYPGEPALGPPVFMHRLSASNDPDAPLSHHYADATHITFGVATLGIRYQNFKLEGSAFKGREPDEFRYGFDRMKFDSYSVRLSYNPSASWALQASNGWIHSPEDSDPDDNVDRFTLSAMNMQIFNEDSYLATTLVYGQNHHTENGKTQPAVLLESNLQIKKTALYGRYEFVQKDAEELDLLSQYAGNPNFNINALTLGVNRILATIKHTDLRLGIQSTVNFSPMQLHSLYSAAPLAFEAYLRISPSLLKTGSRQHMKMDGMEM